MHHGFWKNKKTLIDVGKKHTKKIRATILDYSLKYSFILYSLIRKKRFFSSTAGFEPAIFWSVVRRVIRCATRPIVLFRIGLCQNKDNYTYAMITFSFMSACCSGSWIKQRGTIKSKHSSVLKLSADRSTTQQTFSALPRQKNQSLVLKIFTNKTNKTHFYDPK